MIVRLRPLNKKEAAEEATLVVQKLSANSLSLAEQQFTFDAVAGESESQVSVKPLKVGDYLLLNILSNQILLKYANWGGQRHI